jgi:hypothetical protein
MDSFTLGFLPKIDFTRAQYQHTGNSLRASKSSQYLPKHPLYAIENSILNSEKNTCLEASIYRLRRPKLSLSDFSRRHPEGSIESPTVSCVTVFP